jgi:hypothetical protein
MNDLNDILKDDDQPISEAELKAYLDGKLYGDALYEVERKIADSAFMNDAVEGLQQIQSPNQLNNYVKELNRQLHQNLADKKNRKQKKALNNFSLIFFAVILVLLLCMLAYAVLHLKLNKH